jgi:hypothetical protein
MSLKEGWLGAQEITNALIIDNYNLSLLNAMA